MLLLESSTTQQEIRLILRMNVGCYIYYEN